MNNLLAVVKDSVLTWSRLRGIGKSSAAKITVLLPLIGYLIIFNKNVADFLHLASEFAGADTQFGVAPKLMLVYLGICAFALGQIIYGVFSPAEIKAYGHETPYVLDAVRVTKDFEYEKLEAALRASAYQTEYIRMRDRYERTPGPPITEEQKAHINNGVLHLYFRLLVVGSALGDGGPLLARHYVSRRAIDWRFHTRNKDNLRRLDHKLLVAVLASLDVHRTIPAPQGVRRSSNIRDRCRDAGSSLMDAVLLARAQTEIERGHQCLIDLGATSHFAEIERQWATFLVHFERIFHRLEAAAGGKGNAWYGRLEQFRKQDPLLSYLLHARNADEHGLKTVTKREPGLIREVDAEPMDPSRPEKGMRVTVEIRDPHIALVDVIDRGTTYIVPTTFRGNAISLAHPLNVGLLGLSYAEERVIEARRLV